MIDVIAQGLGIIGAVFNIGSFQLKSNKKLILCQFLGSSFFLFNYLLLGGYTGCIMNGLGVARNLVFAAGQRTRNAYVLIAMNYALILGTLFTWEGYLSLLPLAGMLAATIAMYSNDGKVIRIVQLFVSSPCWLIYNIATFTVGGIVCEVFVIISTLVSFIRFGFNGFERQ